MLALRDALLVFVGAGLGGVCRWGIGAAAIRIFGTTRFPVATLSANLIACTLMGVLVGIAMREGQTLSVALRLFLLTGFLGGLSTMSAFGLETAALLRRGDLAIAGINVLLTLVTCIGAIWALIAHPNH